MREYLLIFAALTTAASAAEPQVYACPPVWPENRECFKEQTIYFNTGSPLLRSDAEQRIKEVASFLKAHPSAALRIEGYCDDRGSEEHNRWLGERRARAAAKQLALVGIAAERIDNFSFGEDKPVDPGHSAKARQKNRRVEFVLLTPPKP